MFLTKILWAGGYMCTSILHALYMWCTCEGERETTSHVFPLTRCAAEIILYGNPLTGDQCKPQ